MVVAVIGWDLEVFGCRSLKDKRRVVRSLKDRLRNRFNISVAETGSQDLWQRAELTACLVAGERALADSVLEQADRLVANEHRARVIDSYRRFV